MCGRSFLMWPMVSLRQNGVPLIRVGLRRGRSWRECDHSTIDGDVIGTSFARGCEHRGERALALSTWHWHRLRRHWRWHQLVVGGTCDEKMIVEEEPRGKHLGRRPVVLGARGTIVYGGRMAIAPSQRRRVGRQRLERAGGPRSAPQRTIALTIQPTGT